MTFKYEKQKIKSGYFHIVGCDEVGRGCLAGPVVAGAVVFPVESRKLKVESLRGVRDSKLLSPQKREELSIVIKDSALGWGIGQVDEKTIDEINIHQASLLAMKLAVKNLLASFRGVIPTDECNRGAEGSLNPGPTTSFKGFLDSDALARNDTQKILLTIDGKFTIPEFTPLEIPGATSGPIRKRIGFLTGLNMEQEAIIDGDNKILSIAAASIIAKVYRDNLMKKLHQQYPVYNLQQHKGYATLFHRTMILKNGLSPIHRKSFCGNLEF